VTGSTSSWLLRLPLKMDETVNRRRLLDRSDEPGPLWDELCLGTDALVVMDEMVVGDGRALRRAGVVAKEGSVEVSPWPRRALSSPAWRSGELVGVGSDIVIGLNV